MKEAARIRTIRNGDLAGHILQDIDSGVTGSLRFGPHDGHLKFSISYSLELQDFSG
jgi:hypothetical protein